MLIVDTDVLIEAERNNSSVIKSLLDLRPEHPEGMAITSAIYAEFLMGIIKQLPSKQSAAVAHLESYKVLDFDKLSAIRFVQLKWALEEKGRMIPNFDLVNASIALRQGATIATGDAHYENIPGLKIAKIKV